MTASYSACEIGDFNVGASVLMLSTGGAIAIRPNSRAKLESTAQEIINNFSSAMIEEQLHRRAVINTTSSLIKLP